MRWSRFCHLCVLRKGELVTKASRKVLIISVCAAAVILVSVILAFAPRSFSNPSTSMLPTIYPGEQFWGSIYPYLTSKPQRGDIVVFKYPRAPDTLFVKRVVGIPGDRIEFSPRLKVNDVGIIGEALEKPLPDVQQYGETITSASHSFYKAKLDALDFEVIDQKEPSSYSESVTVPEGNLFVIGDNISNSHDSRGFGFVPVDHVVAKATRVLWGGDRYFEPIK